MGKKNKKIITYCNGKKCCKYNKNVKDCIFDFVDDAKQKLKVKETKCLGMCKKAPVICIKKDVCLTKACESSVKKWLIENIG